MPPQPAPPPAGPEPADAPAPPRRRLARLLAGASWRYVGTELAMIIAGILIALAANAWWERGERREREAAYLRQLLADTRENERRLVAALADDSVHGETAGRVMELLTDEALPLPPSDSMALLLRISTRYSDFSLVTGTHDALLQTGDINLLRSDSARLGVVAYVGTLHSITEQLRVLEGQTWYLLNGQFMPMLASYRVGPPTSRPVRGVGSFHYDLSRVRRDPRVLPVVMSLGVLNQNRREMTGRMLAQTRELRARLERQVAPGP